MKMVECFIIQMLYIQKKKKKIIVLINIKINLKL